MKQPELVLKFLTVLRVHLERRCPNRAHRNRSSFKSQRFAQRLRNRNQNRLSILGVVSPHLVGEILRAALVSFSQF